MSQRYPISRFLMLSVLMMALLFVLVREHIPTAGQAAAGSEPNLLVNGNFDQLPFYWMPPNHFIAGGWTRWWIHLTVLPEFDDVAKHGGVREYTYVDGGHAQVYFKWGPTYTAGIFQVVSDLTPCRPYEFTMHARTHGLPGTVPGSRIGLDPQGAQLTSDGAVADTTPLDRAIWSREQTILEEWEELSVTAEPQGDRLTAILYASPNPGTSSGTPYYDTYWDAGSLHPTTYASGRLPKPTRATSGYIRNVDAAVSASGVTISWDLSDPGLTQVWYDVTTPSTLTNTTHLTHTTYMPVISQLTLDFDHVLPVHYDTTQLSHTATITDFTPGQHISYVVLARRLQDGACVTEYAGPYSIATQQD